MRLPQLASNEGTLVLGSLSPAEEGALWESFPESRSWRRVERLSDALRVVRATPTKRVLLLQARPGELPGDAPTRLRSANPEIELLSLAGAWCEGEPRTGKPWERVPRLYWHQFFEQEHENVANDGSPLVLVNARLYENAAAWLDTLAGFGCAGVWSRRGGAEPLFHGVRLAIWDGDQLDGREANQLADFCRARRAADAPVIAVFDFPRADAVDTARRVGASDVLGRPWDPGEVERAIAQALGGRRSVAWRASESTPEHRRAA